MKKQSNFANPTAAKGADVATAAKRSRKPRRDLTDVVATEVPNPTRQATRRRTSERRLTALASDRRRKSFLVRLKGVLPVATVFIGSVAVAHLLASLSGTALWSPQEWRKTIEVVSGLVGAAFFHLGRSQSRMNQLREEMSEGNPFEVSTTSAATKAAAHDSADVRKRVKEQRELREARGEHSAYRRAIALYGVVLALLAAFYTLHTKCVKDFDYDDWYRNTKLEDARSDDDLPPMPKEIATTQEAATRPTIRFSDASDAGSQPAAVKESKELKEPAEAKANPGLLKRAFAYMFGDDEPRQESFIPNFINAETKRIMLPLWFPPKPRAYFALIEQEHPEDNGILHVLDNDPDRMVGYLREDCIIPMAATTILFLAMHATIIALATYATGRTFNWLESLAELFIGTAEVK